MKKILFIALSLISLTAAAQPDIQKSIHLAEKHCWDFSYTQYMDMTYVPNVGLYAITIRANWLSPNSGADLVLYRIDATTYDTLWSKAYGGSRSEATWDVHLRTLPNGHVLLAGITQSYDMDFASNPYPGGSAVYFLELDTAGTIVRTKVLNGNGGGGPAGSTLRDVEVDAQGNIYATGDTHNDNMDFAHVANGKDGYVVKLDTNLNKEWMRFWIGYDSDQPGGLGFIQNGNIAVTGVTSDTGTTAMLSHLDKGKGDLYIEAYSPQGVTLWKNRFGGKEGESGRKVVYGPSTNDIYVVGETYSATGDIGYHTAKVHQTFNYPYRLANSNLWILKLDTIGNKIHSKAYGSRSYGIYPQYETHYEDAIWYNGNLWFAMRTDLGGGDFDSIFVNGSNKIMAGTFDDKANLSSKINFNETSVKHIHRFFTINQKLCAMGRSVYQNVVPINTFSCDTAVDDVSFLLNFIETPLSIKNTSNEKTVELFTLYPNPGADKVSIELLQETITNKGWLLITDANGKKLKRKRLREKETTLHCGEWPVGVYYIEVRTARGKQTKTFVKQ